MKNLQEIALDEQGSALITVLIIALIVALFIGAVLGGIYVQSTFIQQDIDRTKALYQAEQQIYEVLYSGEESESTGTITSTNYGGFLKINSSFQVKKQKVELEVLAGALPDSVFDYAIALKDTNSSLSVTGSTTINGDIASGSNKIERSTFKGFPFRGSFTGEAKKENMRDFFPAFQYESLEAQLDKHTSFFESDNRNQFAVHDLSELAQSQEGDTLYFSDSQEWIFNQTTAIPKGIVVLVEGNLSITGDGNLGTYTTFIARDTMSIGGSITATHAIVSAGTFMELRDQVSMNAQLISRGRIQFRDQVYLTYPSMVYTSTSTFLGEQQEVIHLQDESTVDGTLVYPIETGAFNQEQFRIKIDENALVRGSVYNQGQTELDGTVFGSVLTKQFFFYESPTTYINWIKDTEIDITQRPQEFIVPIGFSDSTKYVILDWKEVTE
ncbi:MAG: hypothetical protein ROO71_00050 [Balneola sp.]